MGHLNRKAVWDLPTIHITHFHTDDMLPGETEDEFIDRYILKMKLNPVYSGLTPELVSDADIPSDKSQRNEWSLKNGKVEVDQAKVQAKEAKKAEKDAVLAKLKISEEELDHLLKR